MNLEFFGNLDWKGTLVITLGGTGLAISLSLIFKTELKELLKRVRRITAGKYAVEFGDKIDQVQKENPELDNILALIPAADISLAPLHDPVTTSLNQLDGTLREALKRKGIEAWGDEVLPQALRQLQDLSLISTPQAQLINQLYRIGEIHRGNAQVKLLGKDAEKYRIYVSSLIGWLEKFIIPQLTTGKKPPPRRHTQVGGYGVFPEPGAGRPAALLVAIGGPMKGHSYAVDRERFHIGAGQENDLTIAEDEFVSGRHAYLRYQQGSLFLFDAGSRNGTFLNDRTVADSGMTLAVGDHIRIGESTFRLDQADDVSGGVPRPAPAPVRERDVLVR
jgi:hypothetical protein